MTVVSGQDGAGGIAPGIRPLFVGFACFVIISLLPLPTSFRPYWLSIGFWSLFGGTALLAGYHAAWRTRWLAFLLAAVAIYWAVAYPAAINGSDDNAAYLLFAEDFYRDLGLTLQPLSERRLFAVGGIFAFQAPVLRWPGVEWLSLVEPVLGSLLLLLPVLGRRDLPAWSLFLAVMLVAVFPLLGSGVLANTASSFILAALSLMLLTVFDRAGESRMGDWLTLILIVALPVAAVLIRPTSAPFNALIAGVAILRLCCHDRRAVLRLLLVSIVTGALLVATLLPYHAMSGSWLYPLLGRGAHITAEGLSISGSLGPMDHLRNLLAAVAQPLNAGVLAAAIAAFGAGRRDASATLSTAVAVAAFLILLVLIVVSTGGLAAGRYMAPVAFAMLLHLIAVIASRWAGAAKLGVEQLAPRVAAVTVAMFLAVLFAVRMLTPGVVAQRLETTHPAPRETQIHAAVGRALEEATRRGDGVLFAGVDDGRFIRPAVARPILIMDQPGMMTPWRLDPALARQDYARGLRAFLHKSSVTAILTENLACEQPVAKRREGWRGLMQLGRARNSAALCELTRTSKHRIIGSYTLIFLR